MKFIHIIALSSLLTLGCGSGSPRGGGPWVPPDSPVDHVLWANKYVEISSTGGTFLGKFSLPKIATVSYEIINRSNSTPDKFHVGIFPSSEFSYFENGQQAKAYAPMNNVTSATGSADVSPGDYALGIKCVNVVQKCMLSFDLNALY